MRSISYRARQRLGTGLKVLLILAAVVLLLVLIAIVYLGRYVVYTPDGAYLDFGRNTALPAATGGAGHAAPAPPESVEIEYADPNISQQTAERIDGYYIDLNILSDPDAVLQAIQELDGPCTVMIDLKAGNGSYYYSTQIDGAPLADVDVAKVDKILSTLKNRGFTMVARVKTFQDTAFALEHLRCGLAISGGALWVGDGCYWLDPGDETVVAYLKQIARELAGKGFKEIVFDDFYFPESGQIVYESEKSRTQLTVDTATELLNFFASSNVTISFGNPTEGFPLPEGSHFYISDVAGSGINHTVKRFAELTDPSAQLVFLTGSKDNRFDGYQLLRPILAQLVG